MQGESVETGGSANLEGIKSMEMQIWEGKMRAELKVLHSAWLVWCIGIWVKERISWKALSADGSSGLYDSTLIWGTEKFLMEQLR